MFEDNPGRDEEFSLGKYLLHEVTVAVDVINK